MSSNTPLLIPQNMVQDLLNSETSQYMATEYSVSALDQDVSLKDIILLCLLVYVLFRFIKKNVMGKCKCDQECDCDL